MPTFHTRHTSTTAHRRGSLAAAVLLALTTALAGLVSVAAPAHAAAGVTYLGSYGSTGGGDGQLQQPYGLAVGPNGHVYVADVGNSRIQEFTAGGQFVRSFGIGFFNIAVDSAGFVYGTNGSGIVKYTSSGEEVGSIEPGPSGRAHAAAIDSAGDIYALNNSTGGIVKMTPEGEVIESWNGPWGGRMPGNAQDIEVDKNGFVYVADPGNKRVVKLAADGTFVSELTSANGRNLGGPARLATNAAGQLAVLHSNTVDVFSSNGEWEWTQGRDYAPGLQFTGAYGVGLGDDGSFYVSDLNTNQVHRFFVSPVFDAFTPTIGGSGLVGEALTASATTTPEPASWTYSWTVAGSDVVRSDEATFLPTPADRGKIATVTVTAKGTDGEPRDRVATATKAITGKLMDSAAFSITDSTPATSPTTGDVLTLAVDESKLPDDAAGSVRWGYLADEDCVVPQGATASVTYPVVDADAGTTICAQVAYTAAEYEDLSLDLVAGSDAVGTFTAPTPTVDDETPVVNQTITASVDLEGAHEGAEVTGWQWGVVDGEECTPIAGADEASFAAEVADFEKVLCVTVTVSAPHHLEATKTVTVGAVGASAFAESPSVTIGGWGQVGTESSAAVSGGDPAGADRAYQWNLDGDPITDATNATYTPKPGDEGHVLSVTVTSSSRGYVDDVTTSNELEIARGGLDVASPVFSTDRPTVGTPVSLPFDLTDAPEGAAAHWQWGTVSDDEDCVAIDGATTDTFTPTADQVEEVLCVEAGVTAPGYASIGNTSIAENPVVRGTLPAIRAVLNTTSPKVGSKLTTSLFSTELPAGASTTVTWGYAAAGTECRPTKVAGSFTPTRAMAGNTVCALVTVAAPGYTEFSTVLTSAAVKETAKVAPSRKVVRGTDTFVVKAQGLAPGQRYRISIRHRMFTGKADSHGRIARTVRYGKGLKSAKRTIIVRGYTGKKVTYLKKFTVTYRAR